MSSKHVFIVLTAVLLACSGGDEPPQSMIGTGGPGVPSPDPNVPGATEGDEVPPDPAFDEDTEDPPTDPELP